MESMQAEAWCEVVDFCCDLGMDVNTARSGINDVKGFILRIYRAQHRMHWTALFVGLGSFVFGFTTCAIILALL